MRRTFDGIAHADDSLLLANAPAYMTPDGVVHASAKRTTAKIIAVRAMDDYKLWLRFSTGEEKIFDVLPELAHPAYKPLEDKRLFDSVYLSYGVPTWRNGEIDFAPEGLFERGSDKKPKKARQEAKQV